MDAVGPDGSELNDKRSRRVNNDQGCASGCLAVFGLFVSAIYLSNITMGIVEIPDNLPLIGNLDEVFFSGVLFVSLARLGIRLPFTERRLIQHGAEQSDARETSAQSNLKPKSTPRSP